MLCRYNWCLRTGCRTRRTFLRGGPGLNTPEYKKDTTIYNYTLLSKINPPIWLYWIYYSLPLYGLVVEWTQFQNVNGLRFALAFAVIPCLHYAITYIQAIVRRETYVHQWSFRIKGFWIGLLPDKHTPFSVLWSVHLHLFAAGSAVLAVFYPWLESITLFELFFFHLWLLAPRFLILSRFRKKNLSGWVKINLRDTSYYRQ